MNRSERATIRKLVTELCANYDSQDKISIRGAEVFDSTHRAEGDLEGLLAIADIVIDIDGKEKEEVLKELLT